jgi:Protein of unknown function (DUF5672)
MTFKYTSIIVEPRKHNALEFVLNNICDCLSDEWNVILFHGTNNTEFASQIVTRLNDVYQNRISMVNLGVDNLTRDEYSRLLSTKSIIYDSIENETFLVFQTDSMIFKKNAVFINDFLEYDYVGAPWAATNYEITKNCNFIGNGGFSLRKKSKMLEIIDKVPYNGENEDLYFSRNYNDIPVNKPNYEKATMFCVDEVFVEPAFACHQPWFKPHYRLAEYHVFKEKYPECEILQNLQYSDI